MESHSHAEPTSPGATAPENRGRPDNLSLLGELAEKFSASVRQGEAPSVEEYAREHPQLAARIRELFPTLQLLEGAAGKSGRLAPGCSFGSYRIEHVIGRGGMGVVYLAVHQALQKPVALKVLLRPETADARALERFLREAQTAAALHHTNIVPVFDVGQVAGRAYYAMQYIEGIGLDQVLRRMNRQTPEWASANEVPTLPYHENDPDGPAADTLPDGAAPAIGLPPMRLCEVAYCRWVAALVRQAAEGLMYAHARGVVHRDIKPSNLLLDRQGVVWITDFGLARRSADPALTQPGLPVGTPRYMSPEQAAGPSRPVDHRTDVYGLGVTLYELLAGRPAVSGRTPEEVLQRIMQSDPLPLRPLNRAVHRDLETVVLKAMARRSEDRYSTAQELADDLRRWLGNEPVRARRIGPAGRMIRWCRRSPAVAGLTLAIAALLVTIAGSATGMAFQDRRTANRERAAHDEVVVALDEAEEARRIVETQRDATALALRRAEALRLVAQAQLQLPLDPERALLLALEGARRYRTPQADATLLAALDAVHDGRTLVSPYEVRTAAFSRDGRLVLTTNGRGYTPAQLWDAGTGKQLLLLKFPRAGWFTVLSPDGRLLLSSGQDGTPRLWDAVSGKELHQLEGTAWDMDASVFSPDSSRVVLPGAGNTASVWDTRTGKKLFGLSGHTQPVRSAAFSPDGSRLVTVAADQTVRLWSADGGKHLRTFEWLATQVDPAVITPPGRPQRSEVKRAEFSQDGTRLLTTDSGYTARAWDVVTGKELAAFRAADRAHFSPDGRRVVSFTSGAQFAYLVVHDVATGAEVVRCQGHTGSIWAAAFSPDGQRLASSSDDRTVRLWDAATGKELAVLRGHQDTVHDVAFSPNGAHVVSASSDRTARVWRTLSGKELSTRRGTTTTHMVRVSPDGSQVLIPSWRFAAGVWEVGTRKERFSVTGRLIQTEPSPDKGHLLLGAGNAVRVVDGDTGKVRAVLTGHEGRVQSAAFSTTGAQVVTASEDRTAAVWLTATGRRLVVFRGHTAAVRGAAFDRSGKSVVTASADRSARIWDAQTGEERAVLTGHTDEVVAARFSPDARRVVTTSRDQSLRLWDAATGKQLAVIADADWMRPLHVSSDGERFIVFGLADRTVLRLHRLDSGAVERVLKGHAGRLEDGEFSPDGKHVATAADDGTARLWSAQTGKVLRIFRGQQRAVLTVAFSADGQRLATTGGDTSVRIWDTATGKELSKLLANEGRLTSATFTPNGERVLVESWRDNVVFWDPQSRQETVTAAGHSWQIWDGAFRADGARAVTASFDGTARVWDVRTGRDLALLLGHTDRVLTASFSPSGREVVTASRDRTARVWDVATGKTLAVLKGHEDEVGGAVFSADGKWVLTRSQDGTARLFNATTGKVLHVFKGHEGQLTAGWLSPDGRLALTASSGWAPMRRKIGGHEVEGSRPVKDFTARIWDTTTGKELAVLKHEAGVSTARFSERGDRVLTCAGPVVRIWDTATAKELIKWKTPEMILHAELSPDGGRVLTVSWQGPVRLWNAATGQLLLTAHEGRLQSGGLARNGELIWVLTASGDFRLLPADPLAEARKRKTRDLTAQEREEFDVPAE